MPDHLSVSRRISTARRVAIGHIAASEPISRTPVMSSAGHGWPMRRGHVSHYGGGP
jgi:hypothetical protein